MTNDSVFLSWIIFFLHAIFSPPFPLITYLTFNKCLELCPCTKKHVVRYDLLYRYLKPRLYGTLCGMWIYVLVLIALFHTNSTVYLDLYTTISEGKYLDMIAAEYLMLMCYFIPTVLITWSVLMMASHHSKLVNGGKKEPE